MCRIFAFDFEEIEELQHQGNWGKLTELMVDAARRLEKIGAELVLICTNTMHKAAGDVQSAIGIPLIHIMDVTVERIKEKRLKRVGLLGTRFIMEEDFYKKRLTVKHGIDVVIPNEEERELIHNVIYNELCLGITKPESKTRFKKIIRNLVSNGAEGIILGCTEIPLLINQEDVEVPVFDTTTIHAESAVEYALK